MKFKPHEHPDVRARKLNELALGVSSAGDAAGHAAAAEASALAAAASQAGAQAAETAASNAVTQAQTSATQAQTSATAATNAQSAATTSATAAETAKSLAEQAFADAQGAFTAADAAKDAALQAANDSAVSATSALGSATSAAGQATIAEQRATDAELYASSATAAANIAALKSDAANANAVASSVSSTSAQVSATDAGISASAAYASELAAAVSSGNSSASAAAAATSASAAAASQTASESAASSATSSANTAATQAANASSSASAAATSASAASSSSTAAGSSAAAAESSRIAAEAANTSATSSASAASSSAASASASASTASTQATLSASYSTAARNSMLATVPDNFADPSAWVNWGNWGGSFTVSGGIGITTNGGSFYSAANQPIAAGKRYRLTMRHRVTNVSAGTTYIGVIARPANATMWFYTAASGPVGTWQTSVVEFTGDEVLAAHPTTTAVSLGGLLGYTNAADGEVSLFRIEDITSEVASTASASASASSAAAASSNAATASTQATLSAAYANTKGIIPNGDFEAGPALWNCSDGLSTWVDPLFAGDAGWRYSGNSASYVYGPTISIDPSRRFKATVSWVHHAHAARVHAGFICLNAAGTSLGTIYFDEVIGQVFAGGAYHEKSQVYQGIDPALNAPPHFQGGGKFPVGTVAIVPVYIFNIGGAAVLNNELRSFVAYDETESNNAAAQASIATSQAATATAKAAEASASAVLSATIGQGSLNKNPTFADWPDSAGQFPSSWSNWVTGPGIRTRVAGALGGYALQEQVFAGDDMGLSQSPPGMQYVKSSGYFVVEAEVTLAAGTLVSAGVFVTKTGADAYIPFNSLIDPQTGAAYGNGIVGKRYKFSKLINFPEAGGTTDFTMYLMTNWSGFDATKPAKTLIWHRCSIRDATPQEIRDQTVLAPLQASVSTNSAAIVNLEGRTEAYWEVLAVAGGRARLKVYADAVSGGGVDIEGDLRIINGEIVLDTGTYMKVQGIGFGSSNQFIEWFGPKMALNLCTEANAITYIKTNGDAYFGGILSAGTLKNEASTTALANNASVTVGPFGTNGDPKQVVLSYTYYKERINPTGSPNVSDTPDATIVLEKWNGATWDLLTTLDMSNGATGSIPYNPNDGTEGSAWSSMSGSVTFTDTASGTADVTYRGRITSRTDSTFTGAGTDYEAQRVSVVSTEV